MSYMLKMMLKILCVSFLCFSCGSIASKNNMLGDNEGLLADEGDNNQNILLQIYDSKSENDEDKNESTEEYVKYSLVKSGDSIEYEINQKNLNPSIKRYFKRKNRIKIFKEKRIEKRFGKDKIRAHWDLEFRKKHQEENKFTEITDVFEDDENETLTLKKGSLVIKDWLKINDQEIIQNLDPLYLSKDDTWPRNYVRELKYNKCKRLGLLPLSRMAGVCLLAASMGVEVFFIFKSTSNIHFIVAALYWVMPGSVFWGMGSLCLFDPYLINTRRMNISSYRRKGEEYQIQIKEPSKCRKVVCCMKPKKNSIPGTYRCFGCFSYPDCLYGCFDSILGCFSKISSCCMKICCINLDPKEIVLNIKKDKIPEEGYTIDVKVSKATDL